MWYPKHFLLVLILQRLNHLVNSPCKDSWIGIFNIQLKPSRLIKSSHVISIRQLAEEKHMFIATKPNQILVQLLIVKCETQ